MPRIITPKDIESNTTISGYRNVKFNKRDRPGPKSHGGGKALFQANSGKWVGPSRVTALEAAQDYCDYVNGNPTAASKPALKSAGHTAARDPLERDPEVEYALGVLRDARGAREGNQGYVYCIAEVREIRNRDGSTSLGGGLTYVKVGFSTNPQARVAELQTGNPRPLKLLCATKGTVEDEARLHEKYIDQNVLQEWFTVSRELLLEFDLDPDLNPYPTEDGKVIE